MAHESGQQHPLSIYFWIWGLLFVLSFFSYMVDYMNFQGALRWTLIAEDRNPGAAGCPDGACLADGV
jgi:cytochrome c oxidase subunit IV